MKLYVASSSDELNERFLREQHPEVLAAGAEPHAFTPFLGAVAGHVCSARCVCLRCWEHKSNRTMHPRRLGCMAPALAPATSLDTGQQFDISATDEGLSGLRPPSTTLNRRPPRLSEISHGNRRVRRW